ncbi:hypothetical protein OG548_39070 [Streptomyces sp. NBC_01356]|uniref:hypothetical protein n=1 Tax=Streptomyces sp. NBC_01356 TaxID=2903836 RepID=UPI002E330E06|nr:hypothetical protein [Streptomyces sp. NBC_01356]
MLFLLLAVIVGVGIIVAVALVATGGDGDPDKKSPNESGGSTGSPTPSFSIPSELPSELPSLPSELPSGLESLIPSLADDEVPFYLLRTGDCFDTNDSLPGQAAKRSCGTPHDAEVVKVAELNGSYTTEAALKKAASALCEAPLERKAAQQPTGTVRGTLVQYPDPGGYEIGIDNVACSLAADIGSGTHKLTKPLA